MLPLFLFASGSFWFQMEEQGHDMGVGIVVGGEVGKGVIDLESAQFEACSEAWPWG